MLSQLSPQDTLILYSSSIQGTKIISVSKQNVKILIRFHFFFVKEMYSLLRYRAPWFSERVTLETRSTVTLKPESSEKPLP